MAKRKHRMQEAMFLGQPGTEIISKLIARAEMVVKSTMKDNQD